MKIFLDMEFTSLNLKSQILSLGLVTEEGQDFYAEFLDVDKEKVDPWVIENVIPKLMGEKFIQSEDPYHFRIRGDKKYVAAKLKEWLSQFPAVEIWSDVLAYDWVYFCDLFGDAFQLPRNIYYIPFDIATLFRFCKIDPNIGREFFVGVTDTEEKHNALFDAKIIKLCFEKLMLLEDFDFAYQISKREI